MRQVSRWGSKRADDGGGPRSGRQQRWLEGRRIAVSGPSADQELGPRDGPSAAMGWPILGGPQNAEKSSSEASSAAGDAGVGTLGERAQGDPEEEVPGSAAETLREDEPEEESASSVEAGAVSRPSLGQGQRLGGKLRARMESMLGGRFGATRIHADERAHRASRDLDARAFAIGQDVGFARGEYRPDTVAGQALLAHELAHVAQQSGGGAATGSERELERDANSALAAGLASEHGVEAGGVPGAALSRFGAKAGTRRGPRRRSGLRLQRCGNGEGYGPPVPTDILTIQGHSGKKSTLGWTYYPKGYQAPSYGFNTSQTEKEIPDPADAKKTKKVTEWIAEPQLTQEAKKGRAESFYPRVGAHKTQRTEKITPAAGGAKIDAPVYWNISAGISDHIRQAEQEHVDDRVHAYDISLDEAEKVLKSKVVGQKFGPKPTEPEVKTMVLDTIKNNLVHPKLTNDKTQWAGKFDTLFRKGRVRDTKRWHTYDTTKNRLEQEDKVYYDVDKSATTKVGVVPSTTIVKY